MPDLRTTLRAKFREAEALSARIRLLDQDSEEQKEVIFRWAVVGDETTKLMIQAEEQLSSERLAHLKQEINRSGQDRWAHYRGSEWRIPKFGGPGPGDNPPPTVPLRDLLL